MKKAQFAMEYLLVVAFSIIITVPLIWYLFQGYDDLKKDVNVEHMSELARELAFQTEKIFYQGPGSKTIISAYFPQGVTKAEINTLNNNNNFGWIEFELDGFDGTIERTIYARICENVTLKKFSGPHNIEIIADSSEGCITINDN